MAYIGARLKQARGKVTQEELSIRTGIARTDLSGIENDRISVGSKRLGMLADALGVSVLELAPEEPTDERGRDFLARLEALEAEVVAEKKERRRDLEAIALRLADLEASLATRGRSGSPRQKAGGTG